MSKRVVLGLVSQIPLGEGRTCEVGAFTLAVFRARDGKVYATESTCPHRQGPIADGLLGGGQVICPLHEKGFDLTTGRCLDESCPPLVTYPATLEGDQVVVVLPDS